jgi:hypothetical protein
MVQIYPGVTIPPGITISSGPPVPPTPSLALSLDAAGYTSGPWVDTVSGFSFTLYNGVSYSSDGGGSLQFVPGSSQYAECTTSLSSLNTWTIETWHYYAGGNVGTHPTIVTEVYEVGSSINYALGSTDSSSPVLDTGFYNGDWRSTFGGYSLTAGYWYQIVGTYDGSTIKLYVNSILTRQRVYTYAPTSSNQGIRLMRRWDLANYWGGKLAIVKIFQDALSQEEVEAAWNANKARFGL